MISLIIKSYYQEWTPLIKILKKKLQDISRYKFYIIYIYNKTLQTKVIKYRLTTNLFYFLVQMMHINTYGEYAHQKK